MATVTEVSIEDRLALTNYRAKRAMPKVGTVLHPTPWDLLHLRINTLLDQRDGKPTAPDA